MVPYVICNNICCIVLVKGLCSTTEGPSSGLTWVYCKARLNLHLCRFAEPDPSHTLEERVVHWYFAQLDNNGSHDINKKEMKPFKRYVKKKAKPKRCARKFTDYCDLNKDKTISLQELKGCLGVNKEGDYWWSSGLISSKKGQNTWMDGWMDIFLETIVQIIPFKCYLIRAWTWCLLDNDEVLYENRKNQSTNQPVQFSRN